MVSSGDLIALFEATWTEEQIKTHFAADGLLQLARQIFHVAGPMIARFIANVFRRRFEIIHAIWRRLACVFQDNGIVIAEKLTDGCAA